MSLNRSIRTYFLLGIVPLLVAGLFIVAAGSQPTSRVVEPVATTPTAIDAPDLVGKYQQTITASDLAAHLYLFASDYFEGRETTTRGQKLAAFYLASQYQKMGVSPAGTAAARNQFSQHDYFQPFNVYGRQLAEARLSVVHKNQEVATSHFVPGETYDDLVLAFGNKPQFSAGVVFAGYGISDPELGFDEYGALEAAGINLADKWVLVLPNEPLIDSTRSLLPTPDGRPSLQWTTRPTKINFARQHGPAGFLIVGDAGPAIATGWIEATRRAARLKPRVGKLSLEPQGTVPEYPPAYIVSSEFANQILAPTGRTITDLMIEINQELKPVVFEIGEVTVQSTITQDSTPLETENVAAVIEGSDPQLKDQVVVISSHYDHVGVDPTEPVDGIYNGADDNGSGTVATLEIAEAFVRAREDGYGPRRTILFLNVSGEELGLLGSAYYTDTQPLFPLEQTVANLNMDMVGRYDARRTSPDSNYVYIIGSRLISEDLHQIVTRVNEVTGVNLLLDETYNRKDDPNRLYARSDQWNFGKHGIPFIFFFTGLHEDYHKPGDEPHKIAYERMTDITRLVFSTTWQLANQEAPPAVSGTF